MVIQVAQAIEGPSMKAIHDFERYCRIRLPQEFIHFLSYGNGGIPVASVLPHDGNNRIVERFLPMMADPNSDDAGQYDMSVVMTQLDSRLGDDPNEVGCKLIPFAHLFSGDFLCLDYRKDPGNPEVVLWNHSESEEFSPHTEFVAASFSELEKMLLASAA